MREQNKPENKGKYGLKKLTDSQLRDLRQKRAYTILDKGEPKLVSENTYLVPSSNGRDTYKVKHLDSFSCDCKDFTDRCKDKGLYCKHIQAIILFHKLRNRVELNDLDVEKEFNKEMCIYCNSESLVKCGVRINKSGKKQRYKCKECKKRFVLESLKYVKGSAKLITLTMDLYFKGLSLRDIKDTMKQFYSIDISHETVRNWIRRFTKLMNEHTNKFKPELSDKWHIDEQMVKSKGNWVWSWNVLDEDTRFLIANNVTKSRYIKDAKAILNKVNEVAQKKPKEIISDGLHSYRKAIKKTYKIDKRKKDNVEHIRVRTIRDKKHNNLIERYHNEFREFDKVRRGFKSDETTQEWNEGFRLFHNFIKKGVDGLTPSERAEIPIVLQNNRWLSLLKESLKAEIKS